MNFLSSQEVPSTAELREQALGIFSRAYDETALYIARPLASLALVFALPDTAPNAKKGAYQSYVSIGLVPGRRDDFTVGYDDITQLWPADITVRYAQNLGGKMHSQDLHSMKDGPAGVRSRPHRVRYMRFLNAAALHMEGHSMVRDGEQPIRENRKYDGYSGMAVCATAHSNDVLAHSWHLPRPYLEDTPTGVEPLRYLMDLRGLWVQWYGVHSHHLKRSEAENWQKRIQELGDIIISKQT